MNRATAVPSLSAIVVRLLCPLAFWGVMASASPAAEHLFEARQQIERNYAQQLEQLAEWCDQQGLTDAAKRTRHWLPADRDQRLLLFDPSAKSPAEPPSESAWGTKFVALRTAQAAKLFALARRALNEKRPALASELIANTLRENPEHEAARGALGYQRHEDAWHTSFTLARSKAGQVWDDRFGWLPASRVQRYEAGQRYHRGRWISAQQDAVLHASIDTPWEVDSEHFSVVTNHSLEAAARFGVHLERVWIAWEQVCGTNIAERLDDPAVRMPAYKRHQVMVFRNRSEYQQALRGEIPEDVATTGIYIPDRRTAYFYVPEAVAGQETFDDTVLYHEAVHQLFNETRKVSQQPGDRHNFWMIEGIACYFESLAQRDGFLTVGGTATPRFRAAQVRFVRDEFFVPLQAFCQMGRVSLQQDPRIATLYSQASGVTHFLMHSGGGRRRDGFLAALAAVYAGRDRLSTLPESLGEDFSELDQQYREFMTNVR